MRRVLLILFAFMLFNALFLHTLNNHPSALKGILSAVHDVSADENVSCTMSSAVSISISRKQYRSIAIIFPYCFLYNRSTHCCTLDMCLRVIFRYKQGSDFNGGGTIRNIRTSLCNRYCLFHIFSIDKNKAADAFFCLNKRAVGKHIIFCHIAAACF